MITYTYLGGPQDGMTFRSSVCAPFVFHAAPDKSGRNILHRYRTRSLPCLKRGHRLAIYVGPEKP